MSEPIPFTEAGVLKRHPDNPLLTRADAPYPCSMLFNAGIARFHGRYVMVFRNDYGSAIDRVSFTKLREQKLPDFDGTNLGLAFSADGIRWTVEPKPCIDLETARKLIAPLMPGKNPEQEVYHFKMPPSMRSRHGRLRIRTTSITTASKSTSTAFRTWPFIAATPASPASSTPAASCARWNRSLSTSSPMTRPVSC